MRSPLLLFFVVHCLLVGACGGDAVPAVAPPRASAVSSASAAPSATPSPGATIVVRRNVVSLTRQSGSSVVTTAPDGAITIAFDVLENGRGPHADVKMRLAPDGTIASFEARGHHEMGAPVDETFAIDAGRARWKSLEESGERALDAPAFFVPLADVPDVAGMLAAALIKAGKPLALLPSGEASLEKLGDATVRANDRDKHLVAYGIAGLSFEPIPVWMEDDGRWFGVVDPWFSVVPEGWEAAITPLVEKQKAFARERDKRVADKLAHKPPPAGLALQHARVLDVEAGKWLADQTIVIAGDTIRAIGPAKTTKIPAGAETVDVAGRAVLPGLWDMHQHLFPPDGLLCIGSGVTTARDVGNDPDRLDDMKARWDDGTAIGPHVLRMGFIEGRNEKAASSVVTAETEAEARAAVEYYAKRGYDGIKIYNSVKPELVPLLAKEAHAKGMLVTGHIPVHMLANEAVRAGYDGIEHVNMLFLNFFADHDTDTRTTMRFSLPGDKAGGLDLDSKPVQDFFALLRDKKTVVDPTLVAFEQTYMGEQGKVPPGEEWFAERLPLEAKRRFLTGGLPRAGKEDAYAKSWDKMVAIVRALQKAKVTVVVGTDHVAGLAHHQELALFVKSGVTPIDALRMATIVPARAMKMGKKSGTLAAGKAADLFVVDGDPIAHIEDVRKVVTTVRGGVVYDAKDVLAAVGVKP